MSDDPVNNPSHYVDGRSHQPLDVIEDWDLPYHLGQVLKYISRYQRKPNDCDDIQDLQKAEFYLLRFILLNK